MLIQSASALPLWYQLAIVLRGRIYNAVYPSGSPFPSESDLVREFGVSRVTVRRALAVLARQRLLARRRGAATVVAFDHAGPEPPAFTGYGEELVTMFTFLGTRVISLAVTEGVPPTAVTAFLSLAPGEPAVIIERLRARGDQVVALSTSYMAAARGRLLPPADLFEQTPLPELLEHELGTPAAEAVLTCAAAAADPALAERLQVAPGAPVLHYELHYTAGDGTPLAVTLIRFRGDAHQHRVRLGWLSQSGGPRRGRPPGKRTGPGGGVP